MCLRITGKRDCLASLCWKQLVSEPVSGRLITPHMNVPIPDDGFLAAENIGQNSEKGFNVGNRIFGGVIHAYDRISFMFKQPMLFDAYAIGLKAEGEGVYKASALLEICSYAIYIPQLDVSNRANKRLKIFEKGATLTELVDEFSFIRDNKEYFQNFSF